jgi:hypothetical protein
MVMIDTHYPDAPLVEQLRSHAPMYKRYEYCDCHDDCDNVVGYTYA